MNMGTITLRCNLCNDTHHSTEQHICANCGKLGHRGRNCTESNSTFTIFRGTNHTAATHICSVCNQTGHADRNCLNTSLSSRSTLDSLHSNICNLCSGNHSTQDHKCPFCHQKGTHRGRECANYQARARPAVQKCELCSGKHATSEHTCPFCREKGKHRGRNCPNICGICNQLHSTSNHPCEICSQTGHAESQCPNKCKFCRKNHASSEHRCRICKKKGLHATKKCPDRCNLCNKLHALSEHRCKLCKEASHADSDCPYFEIIGFEGHKAVLFHFTNAVSGFKIAQSKQMRPGNKGMFGGGIYFSNQPEHASIKSENGTEALVIATVELGVSLKVLIHNQELLNNAKSIMESLNCDSLYAPAGYAVRFDEYAVYDPAKVTIEGVIGPKIPQQYWPMAYRLAFS